MTDATERTIIIMYEKNVVIYDHATGNVLRMLKGSFDFDHNIKFFVESVVGRFYVTAAGNESQIWDIHGTHRRMACLLLVVVVVIVALLLLLRSD